MKKGGTYTTKDSKYWKVVNLKRTSEEKPFPYRFENKNQRIKFKLLAFSKGKSMNEMIHSALIRVYPDIFAKK